jgi:carboxyl-terminal processing protease
MPIKRSNRFIPLYVSLGILLGVFIGSFYANMYSRKSLNVMNSTGNKLYDILYSIDDQYVDTIHIDEIVEKAIPEILRGLDPHSIYLDQEQVEQSMAELDGSFSGIGVQFLQYQDSVLITHVIKGGPSENSGLKAGDRIISANGESLVGKDITTDFIMKKLKGPADTKVKLEVVRRNAKSPLTFTIVRGSVPVRTVTSAYMIAPETGYISIHSFGDTTYPEFLAALAKLEQNDFNNLIIDLRGNLGGYMSAAVDIANEFLPKGKLIVYTEGRKSPRENYYSNGRGAYQHIPLVILIDETSASASEILAGAIQDNDRGTIVGRRSFGKGLVQIPINLGDGSMLRLTKARYYTASGRCLQKPYTLGADDEYQNDLLNRLNHGEYYSPDSIKTEGQSFKTSIGRTVYGGGGVIPDHFVGVDTTDITSYYKDVYMSGLMNKFSIQFVDNNREKLSSFEDLKSIKKYLDRINIVDKFANYADQNGVRRRNLMIQRSYTLISNALYQLIINDAFDRASAIEYLNEIDPVISKSLELIDKKATFPTLEEKEK